MKNMHFCSASGQSAGYPTHFLSHDFGISLCENSATVRQKSLPDFLIFLNFLVFAAFSWIV
jgi:hypothetical protein